MNAFAANGYAGRLGAQYRWTEAISSHMQSALLWSAEARPLQEIEAEGRHSFFSSLPPQLRDGLVARALSFEGELSFCRWFMDRFDEAEWPACASLSFAREVRAMIRDSL